MKFIVGENLHFPAEKWRMLECGAFPVCQIKPFVLPCVGGRDDVHYFKISPLSKVFKLFVI